MKKKTRKVVPADEIIDSSKLSEIGENFLFSAVHMNGLICRSMARYGLEVTDFIHHRLKEDLNTAKAMANCQSFASLNDRGMEFCAKAFDDYSSETAKLANLGTNLATETAEKLRKEAALD